MQEKSPSVETKSRLVVVRDQGQRRMGGDHFEGDENNFEPDKVAPVQHHGCIKAINLCTFK